MSTLSDYEYRKYHRQIILPEIGDEGQEKLKESHILVVGAGGLGSPALMYLVAAGVGFIGIADYDRIDISNIHRQILYTAEDVGKLKTAAARDRLHSMNPDCHIVTYNIKITRQNIMETITGYDVVIDCSDNFPTRYLISDATEMMGIPLVFGAVYQFYGQASVFNFKNGPAYRCLFPEMPAPGEVLTCSEAGIIGVIPGIIGSVQAGEAIKIITGAGEVLSGRLLQFDALAFRTEIIKFACPDDYRPATDLGE
jgi:sulfur-carrier protein adenylyltransferase/sulfurtransferase